MSSNTKRVRVVLSAYTRVEYAELLEVPVDFSEEDLRTLAEWRYSQVDGGEFYNDHSYWERGSNTCSFDDLVGVVNGQVIRKPDGRFKLIEPGAAVDSSTPQAPQGNNEQVFAPVVDGDSGLIEIYGYATGMNAAIYIGNLYFADPVVDAYLAHNVTTAKGQLLPRAWVACINPVFEPTHHCGQDVAE